MLNRSHEWSPEQFHGAEADGIALRAFVVTGRRDAPKVLAASRGEHL